MTVKESEKEVKLRLSVFNNRAESERLKSFSYAHVSSFSNICKTYLSANYKHDGYHMRNHSNKQKTKQEKTATHVLGGTEVAIGNGSLAKFASSFEVLHSANGRSRESWLSAL